MNHMEKDSIHLGFQQAIDSAGQIDILINNGYEACEEDWISVEMEQFNRHLRNAAGYFELSRLL